MESTSEEKIEQKSFTCIMCEIKQIYDYFGKEIPFTKVYKVKEEVYVLEDPFLPPKCGEFIILGSHCIRCNEIVCKDPNCSIYFNGTFCLNCAKKSLDTFPKSVQGKINKLSNS